MSNTQQDDRSKLKIFIVRTQCFKSKLETGAKMLFLALCEFANNSTGICWPSLEKLSEYTSIKSRTTLQKHLKTLEALGYIRIQSGKQRKASNVYTLVLKSAVQNLNIKKTDDVSNYCDPDVQNLNSNLRNRTLESTPLTPQASEQILRGGQRESSFEDENEKSRASTTRNENRNRRHAANTHTHHTKSRRNLAERNRAKADAVYRRLLEIELSVSGSGSCEHSQGALEAA